jgi:hypothetical protein
MKPTPVRNSILSILALAGLAAYILACASFSPDDSKVAVPAFDQQTGDFGVGVFDRKTGKTAHLFSLSMIENLDEPRYNSRILRTAWIGGKRVLAAWADEEGKGKNGLTLLTLPVEGGGATRLTVLPEVRNGGNDSIPTPLALAGSRLLVALGSNLVARVDLDSGRIQSHPCQAAELVVYPAGSSDFVLYAAKRTSQDTGFELGLLNADTFALAPLFQAQEADLDADITPALSRDGKQAALLRKQGADYHFKLLRAGEPARSIRVAADIKDLTIGNVCFAAKGDVVYAAFSGRVQTQTNLSLGFLEVPLDGRPAQPTVLVNVLHKQDTDAVRYFEIVLSHDGKTLAVPTTYLYTAADEDKTMIDASDCALFMVDLTKAPYRITKAALPLPKADKPLK